MKTNYILFACIATYYVFPLIGMEESKNCYDTDITQYLEKLASMSEEDHKALAQDPKLIESIEKFLEEHQDAVEAFTEKLRQQKISLTS